MTAPNLFRRRFIPDELISLKDDIILVMEPELIITKWITLHPRKDIARGISAFYLDKGYKACKKFIIHRLLPYYDLSTVISINSNFKSMLIEWSQKESKQLVFEIIEEKGKRHQKEFTAQIIIDSEPLTVGYGYSKKKAEQAAAQKACEILEVK